MYLIFPRMHKASEVVGYPTQRSFHLCVKEQLLYRALSFVTRLYQETRQ